MLNKLPQLWKYAGLFLLLLTVPFGFIMLNRADADNLLANGDFRSDLSGWSSGGELEAALAPQGNTKPILNQGISYPGEGGALTFSTANASVPVSGYVYQDLNIPAANQSARLSFAYKKAQGNGGTSEAKQNISISIVGPAGGTPQVIWEDLTSGQPISAWQQVIDLDISQYVKIPGSYRLRLEAQLQKGDSEAQVNFDQVVLGLSGAGEDDHAGPGPDPVSPEVPSGLVVFDRGLGSRLEISWDSSSEPDIAGYKVYRSTKPDGPFEAVVNDLVTDHNISDPGLENGITYYYRITAWDKGGNESRPSTVVSGIPTKDTSTPNIPADLRVANAETGTGLLLSWVPNKEKDIQGYYIYRSLSANGTYLKITPEPVGSSGLYTDQGLERNVTYWYKVTAVDWANNESEQTSSASGTTMDIRPPAIPEGVKISDPGNGSELVVSWQSSPDQDLIGYNIYRSAAGADFEKLNTTPVTTETYNDRGLTKGVRYSYKIAAVDQTENESGFSDVVSRTPKIGVGLEVQNEGSQVPGGIKVWLDSPALFLNNPQDKIKLRATALGKDGQEIPVSGEWKLYSGNDSFAEFKQISPSTVQAFYRSDEIGDQDIMVEFVPSSGNPVSAEETLRVLDWKVQLSAQSTEARAGSRETELEARVTDQEGHGISDPHAQVLFYSAADRRVADDSSEQSRIGCFQEDGKVEVNEDAGSQGLAGKLDSRGKTQATLTASTIPTPNRVKAVVVYVDNSKPWYQPKTVAESEEVVIDVLPGPASYVGWVGNNLELQAGQEHAVTLDAFDQFGNPTADFGNLKVSIQNPMVSFLKYSLDGGDNWIKDAEWHNVPIGSPVKIKADPEQGIPTAKQGYIMVRIDQGPEMHLPPGINQVNQPLNVTAKNIR